MSNAIDQGYSVRWMIRRDMPDVLRIETHEDGIGRWTEEDFLSCLRQRNAIGMVATRYSPSNHLGEICGFMVYELFKTHMRLLKLAVRDDLRRRGVGTAMIRKLKAKIHSQGRSEIRYMCHERNLTGQLFLKKNLLFCRSTAREQFEDGDGLDFQCLDIRV